MSKASRRSVFCAIALASLVICASAQAQVTLGQLGLPGQLHECSPAGGRDEAQVSVTGGAGYVVPAAGLLTSWSTRSEKSGELGLKVFRPVAGKYLVLAASGPQSLAAALPRTFAVSIPVLPGDLIGIEAPPFAGAGCSFNTGLAGDIHRYGLGVVPTGGSVDLDKTETGSRLNISATLLPAPAVASISPGSGSIKGGTKVKVSGTDFAGATAVSFGSTPATSFTVDSEGQISALSPARVNSGTIDVTVTTAAGTSALVDTDLFTYAACKVPSLNGKKLKAVKRRLKAAGCKLGKVSKKEGATAKTGKVEKQSPKPGKVLAPGSKVSVKLGA